MTVWAPCNREWTHNIIFTFDESENSVLKNTIFNEFWKLESSLQKLNIKSPSEIFSLYVLLFFQLSASCSESFTMDSICSFCWASGSNPPICWSAQVHKL